MSTDLSTVGDKAMHIFWMGAAFGAIIIVLPSLITLAVILARAPIIEDDRVADQAMMPLTMESAAAGL